MTFFGGLGNLISIVVYSIFRCSASSCEARTKDNDSVSWNNDELVDSRCALNEKIFSPKQQQICIHSTDHRVISIIFFFDAVGATAVDVGEQSHCQRIRHRQKYLVLQRITLKNMFERITKVLQCIQRIEQYKQTNSAFLYIYTSVLKSK